MGEKGRDTTKRLERDIEKERERIRGQEGRTGENRK